MPVTTHSDKEPVLLLLPAYGRRYTTQHEMQIDWEIGRDFKIHRGGYTSSRDIPQMIEQGVAAVILQGSYRSDAPVIRIPLTILNLKSPSQE